MSDMFSAYGGVRYGSGVLSELQAASSSVTEIRSVREIMRPTLRDGTMLQAALHFQARSETHSER